MKFHMPLINGESPAQKLDRERKEHVARTAKWHSFFCFKPRRLLQIDPQQGVMLSNTVVWLEHCARVSRDRDGCAPWLYAPEAWILTQPQVK